MGYGQQQRMRSQSLGEYAARTAAMATAVAAVAAANSSSASVTSPPPPGGDPGEQSDSEALNLSYAHSSSDRSGSPPNQKPGTISPSGSAADSVGSGHGVDGFDEAYHSSASSPGNGGHMPYKIRFKEEAAAAAAAAAKRRFSESDPSCTDNSASADSSDQAEQPRAKNFKFVDTTYHHN